MAAQHEYFAAMRCLVLELGADVNKADNSGGTPLHIAAQNGNISVVQCLTKELGADVNDVRCDLRTPLTVAALNGHLELVQYLVKELGADINLATNTGMTPLMAASYGPHTALVKWLIKEGADPKAESTDWGTAENVMEHYGGTIEQTAYLQAKTHCSNNDCSGAGLMKCMGCKQARYCGESCQLAHWKAHKADCKANKKS
jgi:ankyrin repeat protein